MQSETVNEPGALFAALGQENWKEMDYRQELKRNITNVDELSQYLPFTPEEEKDLRQIEQIHPINIPRYYLSLIDPQDKEDPIRKLCVPDAQEMVVAGAMGETTQDPYGMASCTNTTTRPSLLPLNIVPCIAGTAFVSGWLAWPTIRLSKIFKKLLNTLLLTLRLPML